MTTYRKGDLIYADFPFTSGQQSKHRPALVVLDTGDADVLIARLTTRSHQSPYDVRLRYWKQAGLNAATTVRLHKLLAMEKKLVMRLIGHVHADDYQQVSAVMRQTYGAW